MPIPPSRRIPRPRSGLLRGAVRPVVEALAPSGLLRGSVRPVVGILGLCLLHLGAAEPAAGQRSLDGVRVGVVLGGTGFVGASVELFSDDRALDLTVGTWSFRDVSVSLVVKELFGASSFRPAVGVGLWGVWSVPDPRDPDATRPGLSLLVGAPVGFDWRLAGGHYLDAHLHVSRGLWIRRTNPDDSTPLRDRFVPVPGLAYRWDPSR